MLQEILHDFDSADDDEPKLQIVEDNEPQNDLEKHRSNSPDIRQSRSFDKSPKEVSENAEIKKANGNVEFPKPTEPSKIKSLKLKKTQRGTWENKNIVSTINGDSNEIETNNITKENSENLDATKPNSESSEKTTQRSSASTVDTQLPNNQEGLLYREAVDKRKSTEDTLEQSENKEDEKKSRKKKHSQTSTNRKKKQKNAISETEDQVNDDNETLSTKDGNINGEINCEIQEDVLENNDNEPPNSKTGEKSLSKDSKPETRLSTGSDVHEIGPSEINPCLKSVSLYAEQFSLSKYSDSDSNENQSNVKEVTATVHHEADEDIASTSNTNKGTTKGDNNALKDVILLNSNSESDNTSPQPPKPSGSIENKSREKVLANLFGFSNGKLKVGHTYLDSTYKICINLYYNNCLMNIIVQDTYGQLVGYSRLTVVNKNVHTKNAACLNNYFFYIYFLSVLFPFDIYLSLEMVRGFEFAGIVSSTIEEFL